MRYLLPALAVLSLLNTGCPRTQSAGSGTGTDGKEPATDFIAESLRAESLDERDFAMLVITSFGLTGYHDQLVGLAKDDPVAAVTLAAVHQETQWASDYYTAQPTGVRTDNLLGSVFGLACADQVPPPLWADLLTKAEGAERDVLLWGLAQLDIEPGGPLQRDDQLVATFNNLQDELLPAGDPYRLGAVDALLGTANERSIDWQRYLDYIPRSTLNAIQWSALLRWADAATWMSAILTPDLNDRIRYQLGRAVALSAPPEVELPGGIGPWAGIDAEVEYRVNRYVSGRTETIPAPEIEVLIADAALASQAATPEEAPQINQRALGDLLAALDYALVRGEPGLPAAVVEAMPQLPEEARHGVLAAFMRRRPAALTDEQLEQICDLGDSSLAFFLISGWHDRQPVRDSSTASLLRLTSGRENTLVHYGYEAWLKRHAPQAAPATT